MPSGITQLVPKAEAQWHESLRSPAPFAPTFVRTHTRDTVQDESERSPVPIPPQQEERHLRALPEIPANLGSGDWNSATWIQSAPTHPAAPSFQAPTSGFHRPNVSFPETAANPASTAAAPSGAAREFQNSGSEAVVSRTDASRPSLGREVLQPQPTKASEQELSDALESLQAARERHRQLMRDVYGKTTGPHPEAAVRTAAESKRVGFHAAKGIVHPTDKHRVSAAVGNATQLTAEVKFLQQQVDQAATASVETSRRMNRQLGQIRSEVDDIKTEVGNLAAVVADLENTCKGGEKTVRELQTVLTGVQQERDHLVLRLRQFMDHAKHSAVEVQREMATHGAELSRLQQENEFLRVQCVTRRR